MRRLIIDCAILFAIGLLLALLGPFGSFGAPFVVRLLYWATAAYAGYFLYMPAMATASRLADRLELPEPAVWAAACAFASLPMSIVIWCASFLWRAPRLPTLEQAASHYANVLVLGGVVCLLFWFVRRRPELRAEQTASAAPAPLEQPPSRVAFLDRLPPHLGRELIALEMEDHYVRAHTTLGSTMLLMRLRDAAAELDGLPGAQVHRSWWIARGAVRGVRREGRNLRLLLANGLTAPVARNKAAELEAAGWF